MRFVWCALWVVGAEDQNKPEAPLPIHTPHSQVYKAWSRPATCAWMRQTRQVWMARCALGSRRSRWVRCCGAVLGAAWGMGCADGHIVADEAGGSAAVVQVLQVPCARAGAATLVLLSLRVQWCALFQPFEDHSGQQLAPWLHPQPRCLHRNQVHKMISNDPLRARRASTRATTRTPRTTTS